MKQREWVEYESRAASLLPSGGIVMLRLGVIYLQSVLLQVLLAPGPRMTPKCTLFGEVAQWRMLRLVGCVPEGIGKLQHAPRSTTSSYHDAMLTTDPKAMGLTNHRLKLPKW